MTQHRDNDSAEPTIKAGPAHLAPDAEPRGNRWTRMLRGDRTTAVLGKARPALAATGTAARRWSRVRAVQFAAILVLGIVVGATAYAAMSGTDPDTRPATGTAPVESPRQAEPSPPGAKPHGPDATKPPHADRPDPKAKPPAGPKPKPGDPRP